jgi:hypothetical protein
VLGFCAGSGASASAQTDSANPDAGTNLAMSTHVGRLEHIDLPKKDFCLLAAIGLILR